MEKTITESHMIKMYIPLSIVFFAFAAILKLDAKQCCKKKLQLHESMQETNCMATHVSIMNISEWAAGHETSMIMQGHIP